MENRVKFHEGEQRKFLKTAIERLNVNSLRGLLQFGFDVKYSSLKNYYTERRLLPKNFFLDLCHIAKLDLKNFKFEYISGNWGQVKGGKSGRKKF